MRLKPLPSILIVADSLQVGGAERHVVALACRLAERGHEVRIACTAGGAFVHDARRHDVAVTVLCDELVKRRVSAEFAEAIAAEIERSPTDVVHAHMFASAAAAALAIGSRDAAFVVTEHTEAVWRAPADVETSRSVYGRSAAIIAVSTAIRERLVHEDDVPPDRVHVILNGIESRALKRRAGLPALGPTVGVIARLRPEKGVGHFLGAAAQVLAAMPSARFVVVGDGPERAALQERAAELGLRGLRFLGARPDGPELMASFDVLVVPSVANEGTPLVVLEAMAAGVPIVASCTGGIPDQVSHGVEALLVAPGDEAALAHAVLDALVDQEATRRRALAARARARALFGVDRMVDQTEEVYRHALRLSSEGAVRT